MKNKISSCMGHIFICFRDIYVHAAKKIFCARIWSCNLWPDTLHSLSLQLGNWSGLFVLWPARAGLLAAGVGMGWWTFEWSALAESSDAAARDTVSHHVTLKKVFDVFFGSSNTPWGKGSQWKMQVVCFRWTCRHYSEAESEAACLTFFLLHLVMHPINLNL